MRNIIIIVMIILLGCGPGSQPEEYETNHNAYFIKNNNILFFVNIKSDNDYFINIDNIMFIKVIKPSLYIHFINDYIRVEPIEINSDIIKKSLENIIIENLGFQE